MKYNKQLYQITASYMYLHQHLTILLGKENLAKGNWTLLKGQRNWYQSQNGTWWTTCNAWTQSNWTLSFLLLEKLMRVCGWGLQNSVFHLRPSRRPYSSHAISLESGTKFGLSTFLLLPLVTQVGCANTSSSLSHRSNGQVTSAKSMHLIINDLEYFEEGYPYMHKWKFSENETIHQLFSLLMK